ncbi:MAG: tetratricopeptide repeat protein [Nitrospina sp.]|jgi:tetratricopeptide (TPR) repeat protein|nr:tetratricopeptide repeat protein [Nitrospina sp.]
MNLSQLQENLETIRLKGDWSETVEKAVEYANACQQVRKYEAAIACLNKILPDVEGDASLNAVIKTALGTAFWEKAQLQKALNHFEEALKIFKERDDKQGGAAILSIVGITFWRKCDWQKALDILRDANNEGTIKHQRFLSLYGALDRGIATLQNRVRMGRELGDPLKILQPLFSMCALYWVTGNREQLQVCLEESVSLAEQLGKADILNAAKGLTRLASLSETD